MQSYHITNLALRIVVPLENGSPAVLFFELHSGSLIQIPFKLLPFDQRPISIHHIEIFVGVLVDQHPQFGFADMILPGGFFDGECVSMPCWNDENILVDCSGLAVIHRHLPPYFNSSFT